MPARSTPCLKKLFCRLNRAWFRGILPSKTIVRWSRTLMRQNCIGLMENVPGEIPKITLAWEIHWCHPVVAGTLIHEMAHLSVLAKHGARGAKTHHGLLFQKEMLRLAKAGSLKDIW